MLYNMKYMNKINGLILIAVTLLTGCTHHKSLFPDLHERLIYCETSENFEVPIKEGYATYVIYGEDTLAVATEPMVIEIPKGLTGVTKSTAPVLKIDYNILEEHQATFSQFWQAVMFEDTENGDYDYNDLIIHVRNSTNNNGRFQNIDIQPIALGSGKTIALGCILADNSEHIISGDVRKDLFGNRKGYINTVDQNTLTRFPLVSRISQHVLPAQTKASIAWFIEVEGKRYYAISTLLDYKNYEMFNPEGLPYGLVQSSTFAYPQECKSIFKVYPDFEDWINGRKNTIGKGINNLCYQASIYKTIPGADGILYNIWDYTGF